METGVAAVTSIRCFGLGDLAQNSESLCFHGLPLTQLPHTTVLCVQGDGTRDKEYRIYLGIILNRRITFDVGLSRLSPRVKRVAILLGHLFKNIGGRNKVICRHYTCVV